MSAGLALLVLAQVTLAPVTPRRDETASAPGHGLVAVAAASPRPHECRTGALAGARGEGRGRLWARVRRPETTPYCGALARGYAALARDPAAALLAADEAAGAVPGRAAPLVLAGRALSALGRHQEAWERFSRALALDRRAVEDPRGLRALARSAGASGQLDAALRAYRALVPRARLIDERPLRLSVYVEAAATAAAHGVEGLPEAIGYLSEARRQGAVPGAAQLVMGAHALALDRMGRHEEARGVAAEAGGGFELPRGDAAPMLPPGELEAIEAILAESESVLSARDRWQASIALRPEGDPWLEHARRTLARLARAPAARGSR